MSFLELAKKRYSCRSFKNQQISDEHLNEILEAGRIAPTGANKQPQKFLVVQKKENHQKLAKTANVYNAPTAILIMGAKENAWTRPYDQKNILDIDATIATDHMILAATDLGIDSIWVCYFDPKILSQEFNIPAGYEIINILGLGYDEKEAARPDRHEKTRNPMTSYVYYETM